MFLEFVQHVVNGEIDEVARRLAASPALATAPAEIGAARHGAPDFFFTEIAPYLYAGDTALHMAAAAFRRPVAMLLVAHGADCHAQNRRGAQPLHYAADADHWEPTAQAETIEYLLSAGADPNALDTSGVAPLHLAVQTTGRGGSGSEHSRQQQTGIIRLLLERGASPTDKDGRGKPVSQAVTSEWIRTLLIGGSG